jgi:hypothetical protein
MKNKIIPCLLFLLMQIALSVSAKEEKSNAVIKLSHQQTDTTHIINIALSIEKNISSKNVVVSVSAKRMFGMLKLGDVIMDSTGSGSLSFSNKLPGSDYHANIYVTAKIEDDKTLKDTSAQIVFKSKIPYHHSEALPRAMYAPNAPIWLILTFTILFGGIWFMYFKVIRLVLKIKKC